VLQGPAMAVVRALVVWGLLLCPVDAVIESLADFKNQYRTAVSGKTLWSIKELNGNIEGTQAPVGATQLALWSWLTHVTAGPQKTEAKALIAKTYKDQEGLTGGLHANFVTLLGQQYALTANAALAAKYTNVYRKVLGPADEAGSLLELRNQYHSMTAVEQKAVRAALEQPLEEQWDTAWQAVPFRNSWRNAVTYAAKFNIIAGIMDPGRVPGTAATGPGSSPDMGTAQFAFFKELVDNADDTLVDKFTHKMAAEISSFV